MYNYCNNSFNITKHNKGVLDISNINLYDLPRVPLTNGIKASDYAAMLRLQ